MIKVWCEYCSGHGVHYEADYDYEENHCGDIEYKCDECDGKGYVEITAKANDLYCAEIERKISSKYWLDLTHSPKGSYACVWADNIGNTTLFQDSCGTKLELLRSWISGITRDKRLRGGERHSTLPYAGIVTGKQIGRAHV